MNCIGCEFGEGHEYEVPLGDARVLLTLVEGEAVHEDTGLERP